MKRPMNEPALPVEIVAEEAVDTSPLSAILAQTARRPGRSETSAPRRRPRPIARPKLARPRRLPGRRPASPFLVGALAGFNDAGEPIVSIRTGKKSRPEHHVAQTTVPLDARHLGENVVVVSAGAGERRYLIMGIIQRPGLEPAESHRDERPTIDRPIVQATLDQERLVLSAEQEIVLQCGAASITLTRAGKVLIRGTYLLSRSSGTNRIKGGSVQIN